jgi:hypothetical protein
MHIRDHAARCLAFTMLGTVNLLVGCSSLSPLAQLPPLEKLPEQVLSTDAQHSKINDMIAQAQTHQSDAAKQIESAK